MEKPGLGSGFSAFRPGDIATMDKAAKPGTGQIAPSQ